MQFIEEELLGQGGFDCVKKCALSINSAPKNFKE